MRPLSFPAFRAYAPEHDVVTVDDEAVIVPDGLLQMLDVIHLHIKHPTTFHTANVIMAEGAVIIPIRAAGHLQLADLARLGKLLQVPVNRAPADVRVFSDDLVVDFLRGGVSLKAVDGLEDEAALDRVALHHGRNTPVANKNNS